DRLREERPTVAEMVDSAVDDEQDVVPLALCQERQELQQISTDPTQIRDEDRTDQSCLNFCDDPQVALPMDGRRPAQSEIVGDNLDQPGNPAPQPGKPHLPLLIRGTALV